ncbi:MAG: hypothetical protein ACT4PU_05020 [Planctomycetota bacterium]
MKRSKVSPIGLVVADNAVRAAQRLDGRVLCASLPVEDGIKKTIRQVLATAPFVGREVVVGLEGGAVLVESLVVPPGTAKDLRKVCADRLKGDPLFSSEKALLGITVESITGSDGAVSSSLAIMAAMNRDRLGELMQACRELQLNVLGVETAALASWRAWTDTGVQVRLHRSGGHDSVLAGVDDKLLFCRIVETLEDPTELRATIGRAASLLGCEGFQRLVAVGVPDEAIESLSTAIGVQIAKPPYAVTDAAATGLATAGFVHADFTPPEERVLREKRRLRKVATGMAGICGALVLTAGIIGTRHAEGLEDRRTALEQRLAVLEADRQQLEVIQSQLAREEANEGVIQQAMPGHRLSTLFALIAARASDSISFETVKIDDIENPEARGATAAVGVAPRLLELRLNGLGMTGIAVRRFADALLVSGAFLDVRVEASERVLLGVGMEGERFRIYAKAETH